MNNTAQESDSTMAKIAFVIDKLESGGAQRQLAMLAAALKNRGYGVEVFVYHQDGFFADDFREAGVPVNLVSFRNKAHLVYAMGKAIKASNSDMVISYLAGPNALMELVGLFRRRFALIISERCLEVESRERFVRYGLHFLADAVVCNSYSQHRHILETFPRLANRTHIIVNGVDLKRFSLVEPPSSYRSKKLRILVLARVHPQKNPFALVEAMAIVRREQPQLEASVDWYGDPWWQNEDYHSRLEEIIERRELKDIFRLHPAVKDVEQLYHEADVVCLPSLYEGTSNTIREAMACGIPLLVSRTGDNPELVKEERNGLMFDASSAQDIAATIIRFANKSDRAKREMGLEGRKLVEAMSSLDSVFDSYVEIIQEALSKRTT